MTLAEERRHGLDEVSEKIGGLSAGFIAVNTRLDGLALERQQQHVEAIKLLTDTVAQYHEIKHQLAQGSTKFDSLDKKIDRYGATLDRHIDDDLARFNRHETIMRESAEAMERQVEANRESVMARIDDLFAWRNLMRGIGAALSAIAGGMLVVFGHDIIEFSKSLFHWGGK